MAELYRPVSHWPCRRSGKQLATTDGNHRAEKESAGMNIAIKPGNIISQLVLKG
jgi:hypothetical protein